MKGQFLLVLILFNRQIASLFPEYQGEVFEVIPPGQQQRESFFKQLFVHSACDIESNGSSQEEALSYRRSRLRARSKICAVRSAHVMTTSKSKINVKRKNSASGAGGPPSKRTKNFSPSNLSVSSSEKMTDSQTEELLRKIVETTETWPSYDLESLYTSLELTLDRSEEDLCTAVEERLEHFKELRRTKKAQTKKDGDD